VKLSFKTVTNKIVPTTTRNPGSAPKTKEREGAGDEVNALARGLTVLRCIAVANAPVSNRELAELTGIPKPTVSRITATLVGTGFLFQLPDSERFVLTASVLELSNGFLRNFDIRARARPFLTELAERTSLSVHLAVRDRLDGAHFASGSGLAHGPRAHVGGPCVSGRAGRGRSASVDDESRDGLGRRLAAPLSPARRLG